MRWRIVTIKRNAVLSPMWKPRRRCRHLLRKMRNTPADRRAARKRPPPRSDGGHQRSQRRAAVLHPDGRLDRRNRGFGERAFSPRPRHAIPRLSRFVSVRRLADGGVGGLARALFFRLAR